MIILMKNNQKNNAAAKLIEKQHSIKSTYDFSGKWSSLKNASAKHCFIIDLDDETGLTSNALHPEIFASRLHDYQLPPTVTDLYLLVSQSSDFPLALYSHRLSQALEQRYQRKIAVHTISSLNHDRSLLSCLPEQNKWQIHDATSLIWEGDNIQKYMNSNQQTFDGKAYAWDLS